NAIKFSPEGSHIECVARAAVVACKPFVICSITDHGQGIDSSKHDIIFSPFLRADEQGRDGIGLGLAFVKMVVERHGGRISLSSTPGEGSTFTIMLPCTIDATE
ncbi:MAG TPA: ATP-binding protein, partial [Oxalicibacterium sp.]